MVTREDVENIALLSKLFVPEEELDGLTKSMQEIIDFAPRHLPCAAQHLPRDR